MPDEDLRTGRRSTDADLAVVVERLDVIDQTLGRILSQTVATNGRVSELEVKDRIRQDRDEQDAMHRAARNQAHQHAEQGRAQAALQRNRRLSRRMILAAAAIGACPGFLTLAIAGLTGHL